MENILLFRVVTSLAKSQECDIVFDLCNSDSMVYAYGEVDEFEAEIATIFIHDVFHHCTTHLPSY